MKKVFLWGVGLWLAILGLAQAFPVTYNAAYIAFYDLDGQGNGQFNGRVKTLDNQYNGWYLAFTPRNSPSTVSWSSQIPNNQVGLNVWPGDYDFVLTDTKPDQGLSGTVYRLSWGNATITFGNSFTHDGTNYYGNATVNWLNGAVIVEIYSSKGQGSKDGMLPSAVPLPASAWLFGGALLGGFFLRRRQKSS